MKKLKANVSIEMVVIVPLILMVIAVVISILFYYHDKNVIKGVSHETAMMFSNEKEMSQEEVLDYLEKGLRGKLLVFSSVGKQVLIEEDEIQIICSANRRFMQVYVESRVKRTEPEVWIRRIRLAEKLANQLGEKQ